MCDGAAWLSDGMAGMEHSPAPVGTAHKKINPMAELPDMNTRERFWQQDQEQEKVILASGCFLLLPY